MHDSASAHFLVNVKRHLTNQFSRKMDRTWRSSCMATSLTGFKFVGLLSMRTLEEHGIYVTSVTIELPQRIENCCHKYGINPESLNVFDLQWGNVPNCVLKWMEDTLNIYCKFKLFSIFHRRKCLITHNSNKRFSEYCSLRFFKFVLTSTTHP